VTLNNAQTQVNIAGALAASNRTTGAHTRPFAGHRTTATLTQPKTRIGTICTNIPTLSPPTPRLTGRPPQRQ
jgi:hypothetical protein